MIRKFTGDLKYYFLAKAALSISWILILKVFTEALSPEDFGIYSLTYTTLSFSTILATSWLSTSIIRFYSEHVANNSVRSFRLHLSHACIFNTVFSSLLFWSLLFILKKTEILNISYTTFFVVALCFPLNVVFIFYSSYLSAARITRKYAILIISQIFIYLLSVIFLYQFGFKSLTLVFMCFMVSLMPMLVLSKYKIRAGFTIEKLNPKRFKKYLQYGVPLLFVNASIQVNAAADIFILKAYRSNAEVGIYSAYYTLSEKVIFSVASLIMAAAMPIIFQLWEKGKKNESYLMLWKCFFLFSGVAITIYILLHFYGDYITSLFINEAFSEGRNIMPYILLGAYFAGSAHILSDTLTIQKKTILLAKCFVFSAAINIVLNLVFIPNYGYMAAAKCTLVSYVILFLTVSFSVYRNSNLFSFLGKI